MSNPDPELAKLHSRLFEEGLEVRRAVLGHEYVDNAVKNATPFTRPGQELITEWAWGTIWKRPGLDRKQRSLLSKYNPHSPPPTPRLNEPRGIVTVSAYTLFHHPDTGGGDLGIIIAQKAWLELVLHTRGAINNGLTEVEIREVVLQATVYCGTPAGVEAMQVTERTINEMIANGEYKRPEA